VEVLDIIKQLCKEKNISISQLENELDFGNGSIAKSKGNMSADRMYQIAKYLKVPMEYLMTGKTIQEADDEVAIIRQQQSILLEISKVNEKLSEAYKTLDKCKDELVQLKTDYNKLELKKRKAIYDSPESTAPQSSLNMPPEVFDVFNNDDFELPFN
jgi:transcriptional regulator with XRE-family HTH domain